MVLYTRFKMTRENFPLTYYLTRVFFLGLIFSFIISKSGNDALLSCIIGSIIGCIFIFILNKASLDNPFYHFLKIILYLIFLLVGCFVLEIYINDFFLIQTPKYIIIVPTIILCIYTSFKKRKTIKHAAFILFFLSITIYILTIFFLMNIIDYNNIFPMFIQKPCNILRSSLMFASLSTMPHILLKKENIPLKKHLKYYLITSVLMLITCFIIIGALSSEVTKIYRFPEYIVLKRIKIFNSIENVENILCTIWYIDYFMFLCLLFKNIYEEVKENKIIFYILIISVVFITSVFLANIYYPIMFIYHNLDYIFLVFYFLISFSAIKKLFISSERHK